MAVLLTQKLGMMSMIDDEGSLVALTLLYVKPNFVSQVKTLEKDGYDALQIATQKSKKIKKPQIGHLKKALIKEPLNFSREERLSAASEMKVGQEIGLDIFSVGDGVQVRGISKGKGFAGVIKRHNFSCGRKSHGGKGHIRGGGSIGDINSQKVFKGKKMAGRMGNRRVTVKGLKVALVDPEKRVIGITGAVPGPKKSLIIIKK